jgi:hypothetical protein
MRDQVWLRWIEAMDTEDKVTSMQTHLEQRMVVGQPMVLVVVTMQWPIGEHKAWPGK